MNDKMRTILESKRLERSRLAVLPFAEKIPLLEKLRDRALAIGDSALYQTHGSRANKAWVLRETGPANQSNRHGGRRSGAGMRDWREADNEE